MKQRIFFKSLQNLRLLRADMVRRGWVIDAFLFRYKTREYIVLVKLFKQSEYKPRYSLVRLQFVRADDIRVSIEVNANVYGLDIDARTLCRFFGVEVGNNPPNDIFGIFYSILGRQIPTQVNKQKSHIERIAISKTVSKDESEFGKVYCFLVRRNAKRADGQLGQRSRQNEELARALYPELFRKLKDDTSLSFCFSADPKMKKSSVEILKRWIEFSNRVF